ncbi:MAG: O-antigen ligase family protein [Firmicutes bacterium]|nr:O-antigen ligase family protein [Bacillota bacterium]
MSEIIRNSRLCRGLRAAGGKILSWWRQGCFAGMYRSLQKQNEDSASLRLWLRFGQAENYAEDSLYARTLHGIRHLFEKLGVILAASWFYRILLAIKNLYLRISAHSRVLGWINSLSLHQWLLVAFGLYLPLEYVIRDFLGIPLLSSVWEELFLFSCFCMVLWRRALQQTKGLNRETPLDAWLLLFAGVGLVLAALVRPYPYVVMPGYRIVVQYMLWFFIIIRLVESDKDFQVLYVTMGLLVALLALHGMYQYVIGVEIPAHWVSQTEMGVRTRVFSITGSPNILGSLMVLFAPICASGIYYCRKPIVKFLCLGLVGCCLLTLLFTFSRGAWIGMIVAVLLFALFVDKRLIALMAAGISAVLVAVPSITSRITYLFTQDFAEASAIGGRAMRWELGRSLLTENNPWLGFGLGRYGGAVAMQNKILDPTETFDYFYLDNYYLKTMVEMGYLGFIFYCLLLLALVIWGIRAIQQSGPRLSTLPGDALQRGIGNKRILAVSLFSGMIGVLVHCLFENIFEEPFMSSYFWAMAAMLLYLGFFRKKAAAPENP